MEIKHDLERKLETTLGSEIRCFVALIVETKVFVVVFSRKLSRKILSFYFLHNFFTLFAENALKIFFTKSKQIFAKVFKNMRKH
jgi:hypothetical protein